MNVLEKIIERKRKKPSKTLFSDALKKEGLSLIAEIKRKSPSKGVLREIEDPSLFAKRYEEGGADVISILTDYEGFGGSAEDVKKVAANSPLPLLRKDFITNYTDLAETVFMGAHAVLLIVAILQSETKEYLHLAHKLGLEALVEVHTPEELQIAIDAGAKIIGINNRDLKTFKVDLLRSIELIEMVPEGILTVSESGIESIEDVKRIRKAGFDAVLIGERLVRELHPERFIRELKSCS